MLSILTRIRLFILRGLKKQLWLCFLLLCACFFGFSILTFNLFILLQANFELWREHGLMAAGDGALQQLLELAASALISMACLVGFKLCEKILVDRLSRDE